MLDISGAGAQLPMRWHGKLRPGPQSHKKKRAAMQALQSRHTHSKQQSKRYKASGPATATYAPVPPQAHTRARCRPECHVMHLAAPFEGERQLLSVPTGRGSPPCSHAPPLPSPFAFAPPLAIWTVSGCASLRGVKEIACFCAYVTCGITKTAQYQ